MTRLNGNHGLGRRRSSDLVAVFVIAAAMIAGEGCSSGQSMETTTPEAVVTDDDSLEQEATMAPVEREQVLSDEEISNAIATQLLFNDAVRSDRIDHEVRQGVVTLRGQVQSILAKQEAVRSAEMIRGVRSIVDLLEVRAPEREDAELVSDVHDALLFDAATDSLGVAVTGTDGRVTLSGAVDSWQQRELVERVASGVRGVRAVDNRLVVDLAQPRNDAEILRDVQGRLTADRWVDEEFLTVTVDEGLVAISGVVDNATERRRIELDGWVRGTRSVDIEGITVSPWSEDAMEREPSDFSRPTDAEVEAAVVQGFLYDPRVFSFNPEVSANDGVVTLRGTVDSVAARAAAEATAMNTIGVWRVRNFLRVEPPTTIADEQLEERVRTALAWNPWIDRHDIQVEARMGALYLYGSVDNDFERREVGRAASHVNGSHYVENMVEIRDGDSPQDPDWLVKQQIESQLFWDPWVISDNVEVEVEGRRALLTGTVNDWRAYNAAILNAHQGGAREVVTRLMIHNGAPSYLSP
jgi:osmotically-inducible protein OsmY